MDTSFFPSYQAMLDTLTSLQSKVQPLQGLSNYKNGKKYYEVLVENSDKFYRFYFNHQKEYTIRNQFGYH